MTTAVAPTDESTEPTIRVRCYFKREDGEIIHPNSADARRAAAVLYELCTTQYGDLRVDEVPRRIENHYLLLVASFAFVLDAKKLVASRQESHWSDTKKWFGFSLVKLDYSPPSRTLWVGNAVMRNGVVDQRQKDAFAQFGAHRFFVTPGKSVFVTYDHLDDAKRAVDGLHGLVVDPMLLPLRVNYTYAETTGPLRGPRSAPSLPRSACVPSLPPSASPPRQGLKFFFSCAPALTCSTGGAGVARTDQRLQQDRHTGDGGDRRFDDGGDFAAHKGFSRPSDAWPAWRNSGGGNARDRSPIGGNNTSGNARIRSPIWRGNNSGNARNRSPPAWRGNGDNVRGRSPPAWRGNGGNARGARSPPRRGRSPLPWHGRTRSPPAWRGRSPPAWRGNNGARIFSPPPPPLYDSPTQRANNLRNRARSPIAYDAARGNDVGRVSDGRSRSRSPLTRQRSAERFADAARRSNDSVAPVDAVRRYNSADASRAPPVDATDGAPLQDNSRDVPTRVSRSPSRSASRSPSSRSPSRSRSRTPKRRKTSDDTPAASTVAALAEEVGGGTQRVTRHSSHESVLSFFKQMPMVDDDLKQTILDVLLNAPSVDGAKICDVQSVDDFKKQFGIKSFRFIVDEATLSRMIGRGYVVDTQ